MGRRGERVVQRQALELGLLRLALGDVAQDRDADPFLVDPDPAERGLDREVAPVLVRAAQLAAAAGLRQSLEREAVLVGQQGRDRAADRSRSAGAPKIRSAARLQDRTVPPSAKVTMASKLLSTSWRIMSSLAGSAPIWPTRAPAWRSTRCSIATLKASSSPSSGAAVSTTSAAIGCRTIAATRITALLPPSSTRPCRHGRPHEQGPTSSVSSAEGEDDRGAVEAAQRAILDQGLERERLQQRPRQRPVARHAAPVAELDRRGADQDRLAGDRGGIEPAGEHVDEAERAGSWSGRC